MFPIRRFFRYFSRQTFGFFYVKFNGDPIVIQSHFQSKFNPDPIVFQFFIPPIPCPVRVLVSSGWFPHAIEPVSFSVFFLTHKNQKVFNQLLLFRLFWNVIFLSKTLQNQYNFMRKSAKRRERNYSITENGRKSEGGVSPWGRRC